MKNKKHVIYAMILALVAVGGLVFANREIKDRTSKKPSPKSSSIADKKIGTAAKTWANSPDGIKYMMWEISPEGKRVYASHDKIKKDIKAFSNMEAVVTSVTFKRDGKSSGIKWLIVSIRGEEYMMQFVPKDFERLNSLKVNDKIIIRSHSAGYSPNHPYLIVSGDYIEQNGKVLFKRDFSKNKGC